MIETIIKHILGELRIILAAPISFAVVIVASFAIIWWIMDWRYGGIISNRESELQLVTAQRDDYRDKLKGASPDEAKAKIETLQNIISQTIGAKWPPLTKDQSERLTAAVATLSKRRIQVMYANQLGKELAQSIADAFVKAGWKDMHFSEGGGLGIGVGTGRGNGMALTLKQAVESSTGLKVDSFGPDEPDTPGIVFVSVGINPG